MARNKISIVNPNGLGKSQVFSDTIEAYRKIDESLTGKIFRLRPRKSKRS